MASPRKKNLRRRLGLHHTLVAPVETIVVEEPLPVAAAPKPVSLPLEPAIAKKPAPLPAKPAVSTASRKPSRKPAPGKAKKASKRSLRRLQKSKKV